MLFSPGTKKKLLAAWLLFHGAAIVTDSLLDFPRRAGDGAPSTYGRVRSSLIAPFDGYLTAIGTHQKWRMFAEPNAERSTFVVRGRGHDDGSWRVLYESHSETATWNRARFEHPSMRKMSTRWKFDDAAGAYTLACRQIARAAFADFSDLDKVECGYRTPKGEALSRVRTFGRDDVDRREE
jgi:hypothetical protein